MAHIKTIEIEENYLSQWNQLFIFIQTNMHTYRHLLNISGLNCMRD